MSIVVKSLSPDDRSASAVWDTFVAKCVDATFFHKSGWQRILRNVFCHRTFFLYAERAGEIEGVLPLAQVKSRLFGNSLVSLPFAVYGGIVATNDEAAMALEQQAKEIAENLSVEHLELRNIQRCHPEWPVQDLYVRFRRMLADDVDANMLAIPRKQRAMVRKGIKNGLRSGADDTCDRFFALYADNVHRHGTPALPKRYFEALQSEFDSDFEILTVTSKDGQPLSSVLSFYFRDEVLPYYAGDEISARDLAANDFKYWELMRRSCERGLKVFDYGRSKKGTGSYAFKKNWGFEPEPLNYEYFLYRRDDIPQNNPSNVKYRMLIEAWRRMPISLANWLGPYIVRNLG